jgi:non-canonical poly(A) RNA polymerase PAPD5/7
MMASAYQRAESIRARRSGRFVSLRNNQTTQEEWSILASVMGITQETINHRRVVQEVYDKGVLHRILGLERPGDAISHPKQAGVAGVWEANESDSAKSNGEISSRSRSRSRSRSPSPKPQSKKRQRIKTENSRDEEEEESRYGIVKDIAGLPTKRRRTGGEVDSHTVFTTDEDGEYDIDSDSSKESSDDRRRKGGRSAKGGSSKEKRSYWLSKGVGPLEEDSE